MAVTARFFVAQITQHAGPRNTPTPAKGHRTVKLHPAYANGANKEWASATPSGTIELQVGDNPAAAEFERWMAEGKDVAITFEPVD